MADDVDGLKARARAMREGLEPELSAVVDVMLPMDALTRAATHSRTTYPHTPLRLYVEALGGVIKPVLDRSCSVGVIGSLPSCPKNFNRSFDARSLRDRGEPPHRLAGRRGVIPLAAIAKELNWCSPTAPS